MVVHSEKWITLIKRKFNTTPKNWKFGLGNAMGQNKYGYKQNCPVYLAEFNFTFISMYIVGQVYWWLFSINKYMCKC